MALKLHKFCWFFLRVEFCIFIKYFNRITINTAYNFFYVSCRKKLFCWLTTSFMTQNMEVIFEFMNFSLHLFGSAFLSLFFLTLFFYCRIDAYRSTHIFLYQRIKQFLGHIVHLRQTLVTLYLVNTSIMHTFCQNGKKLMYLSFSTQGFWIHHIGLNFLKLDSDPALRNFSYIF